MKSDTYINSLICDLLSNLTDKEQENFFDSQLITTTYKILKA